MTPFDPLASTHELISFALSHPNDEDDETYWEVVSVLRKRGTREVLDAATALLTSACAMERELGANIHSQLGWEQDKPFRAESVRLLVRLLEAEEEERVVRAALFAFSHLHEPDCIPTVARFTAHPDQQMRYACAVALGVLDDERAVALLIELTTDPSALVRDWATFALATLGERDGPELRAALWARTTDSDNVTRGEALKGLASRKVPGAGDAIVAELGGPDPHDTAVEAAEFLAAPLLIPALERLRDGWNGHEDIERVIEVCRAGA